MKQISIETKASIIDRFNIGESVSELTEATGVACCAKTCSILVFYYDKMYQT